MQVTGMIIIVSQAHMYGKTSNFKHMYFNAYQLYLIIRGIIIFNYIIWLPYAKGAALKRQKKNNNNWMVVTLVRYHFFWGGNPAAISGKKP